MAWKGEDTAARLSCRKFSSAKADYVDIIHDADDAADEDYMFLVLMLFCLVLMVLMVVMVSLMLLMQDVQPEKKEKQLSWWRRLLNMLTKGKKSVRRTAKEQNRLEYL